jgi:autotransporter-associated beta strand protein
VTLANTAGTKLVLSFNQTIASLSGGGTNGGNVETFGDVITLTIGDASNTTYAGILSGDLNLVKQGSGTLTLSGANTNWGTATINAGTLRLSGGNNRLYTGTQVTLANVAGATLDLNNTNQGISTLNGGGANGGNVKLGSGTLTFGSGTFAGIISGKGNIVCYGATLLGNNTYSGTTTVRSGTLQIGDGISIDGLLPGNASVASSATLAFANPNDVTYAGIISGKGGLTKTGAGKMTLTGMNTLSGNTTIQSGTLQLGDGTNNGAVGGSITNNSALIFNINAAGQSFGGSISGTGTLDKFGPGTLTLMAVNTYSGDTIIHAGTISLGNSNALGFSTLYYDNYGGKLDVGTLTAVYLGGLKGSQGLALVNADFAPVTLSIGDTNSQHFDYSGVLSGSGTLRKGGLGTLTLSGNNTYTGDTYIDGGTLALGVDNALPAGNKMYFSGIASVLATDGHSQTDALGSLTVLADSMIDMGSTDNCVLKFAASAWCSWSKTVTITNWNGSLNGGGGDELFFGSSADALTSAQLSVIIFANPNGLSGNYSATILPTGEVVPVPEPSVIVILLTGGLLLGGVALRRRHRLARS